LAEQTIGDLISDYDYAKRQHVIKVGNKPKWVLVPYSTDLMSSEPDLRRRAREAMDKKCLVILDPMSLLHKTVYQEIVNNWGLQGRENAFVIGLAPCDFHMHVDFQQVIPIVAGQMKALLHATYDRFAQPFDPEDQCVLEVAHQHQFARWLQVAADSIITAGKSPLRFGTMNPAYRRRIRSLAPAATGAGVVVMGTQGPRR
jgi:hypothetical protein